jgi:hypothetical protein
VKSKRKRRGWFTTDLDGGFELEKIGLLKKDISRNSTELADLVFAKLNLRLFG